jgi:hypothetical protein
VLPYNAIRSEDVCRREARSGQSGTERPEQLSFDEDEQEDVHASHHWTLGDNLSGADADEQCAYELVSRLYPSAEANGGIEVVKD